MWAKLSKIFNFMTCKHNFHMRTTEQIDVFPSNNQAPVAPLKLIHCYCYAIPTISINGFHTSYFSALILSFTIVHIHFKLKFLL